MVADITEGGHDECHDHSRRLAGRGPALTVEDMENMPDDEFRVFELRSGRYEEAAHVTGDEEYRATAPFPVTIVPAQLVTVG